MSKEKQPTPTGKVFPIKKKLEKVQSFKIKTGFKYPNSKVSNEAR